MTARFRHYLFAGALALLPLFGHAQYCTSAYTTGCGSGAGDEIDDFTLNGASGTAIVQTATGCGTAPLGYQDFTALTPVVVLAPGGTYTGSITSPTAAQSARIWIDFNNDGTFAAGEIVGNVSGYGGATTGAVVVGIPGGASTGLKRMRVRALWNTTVTAIPPCTADDRGETHDYTVNIAVPPPAPTVVNNGPKCAGTAAVITATSTTAGATFTLTGPGITGMLSSTTGVFAITAPAAAGTYVYSAQAVVAGAPSAAATTSLVVLPLPTVALGAVTAPTSCTASDGQFVLTGLTAGATYTVNYLYNGTAAPPVTGVVASPGGTYTISALPTGTYTGITVTAGSGCTSLPVGPAVLTAPGAPAPPSAGSTAPICLGDIVLFAASGTYPGTATFGWFGPGGWTAAGPSPSRGPITYADSGTYYVFATVGGCPSAATPVVVTITPPPPAPGVLPIFYCQGSAAASVTAVGSSVLFYASPTAVTPFAGPPTPVTSVPDTLRYYATQTVSGCESPRAELLVIVQPRPDTPTATTYLAYCQFASAVPLSATGTGVIWYPTATGGGGIPTPPTPATTVPGSYFFYVTQTVDGCESERLQIEVEIKAKPAPPTVVSPLKLCQYDVVGALAASGTDLKWYNVPVGGGAFPSTPTPPTGYVDTLEYYVSQTVAGCESDRALLQVTVNFRPNISILAQDETVCEADTLRFFYFGNGTDSMQYNWAVIPATAGSVDSGQGTQTALISFGEPGVATITLQVENRGCLSATATETVTVRPAPKAALAATDRVCEGGVADIIFTAATPNIDSFFWSFSGGDTAYASIPGGPWGMRWEGAGPRVVSVVIAAEGCKSAEERDTVYVEPRPTAQISAAVPAVCSGDSVLLTALYNPDYTYTWGPARAFSTPVYNDSVWALADSAGTFFATVSSGFGCAASDTVRVGIEACCMVSVPTAFTPNGDSRNDRFRIISAGNQEISVFRVFNRWGRLVWESADDEGAWDGTYQGEPQELGVYFWYLRYRCSNGVYAESHGEVTLVR